MKQCLIDKITTLLHGSPLVSNLARKKFVARFIIGLINSRKVQFPAVAQHLNDGVAVSSNQTRIENFFRHATLDYLAVAHLLLRLLPASGKCRLCIDRTEWNFGHCEVNLLVVTVGCGPIQLPFYWELLDNRSGNSATADRIKLLQACVAVLGKERIGLVMGDREFVGHAWFKYLKDNNINFIMRLPKHHLITLASGQVRPVTELAASGQGPFIQPQCQVDGVWGNVWLKELEEGEYLFLFGTVTADFMGQLYRKRWTIEACFQNLKKRGFDLASTHLSCLAKLKKLMALTSIAYGLCLSLGTYLHQKVQRIKTKPHGYKAVSFSRHGLNFLQKISRPLASVSAKVEHQLTVAFRWMMRQRTHYQAIKIVG